MKSILNFKIDKIILFPFLSLKERSTQIALLIGLVITLFSLNIGSEVDLAVLFGHILGSIWSYSFPIWITMKIILKIKKPIISKSSA